MARRAGNRTAFWNNVAAGGASTSTAVELPRQCENLSIWVVSSGATTITLQAGHGGNPGVDTVEGIGVDTSPSVWYDATYTNIPLTIVFTTSGNKVMMVPDCGLAWIRLHTLSAVTLTAGWEAQGDD